MPTAKTTYSIVDFTVAQAAIEDNGYGQLATGTQLELLPVYNATEPLVQHVQGSDPIELADSQLGPAAFYVTEPTYRMSATTYVYCSDPDNPPPWARILLQCSGFKKSVWTGTAPSGTFTAGTLQTPGKLGNGTYKYVFSEVDNVPLSSGNPSPTYRNETPASSPLTVTVTGGPANVPLSLPAATAGKVFRIYRTKAGGNNYYFVAEMSSGAAQTYVDSTPDDDLDISRSPVTTTGGTFFYPLSEHFPSAQIKVFMHSHSRTLIGARGTWTLDAEAGRAMPMRWDINGLYNAAAAEANPSIGVLNPGIPFIFRNAVLTLAKTTRGQTSGTGATITAIVKSVSITPGTPLDNRRDASTSTGLKEIGIHRRFDPRFEVVFEVDRDFAFDAVEEYNKMTLFSGVLKVGSGPVVRFHFPNMQIMDAPALVNQDGGILCWRVAFRPRPYQKDDFMKISMLPS